MSTPSASARAAATGTSARTLPGTNSSALRRTSARSLPGTRRDALLDASMDALRDVGPVTLAIGPFAMLVGVTMTELEVPLVAGHLSSLLIFSGSVQLAALTLLHAGAGLTAILVTAAVLAARLLVYSAALAPRFSGQRAWFRWLGPHLLVDQTFALATARTELTDPDRFRRYWLTAGFSLGAVWMSLVGLGTVIGPVIGSGSALEVTAPALFVGMLVPRLRDRRTVAVAGMAAVAALALTPVPRGGGLPLAIAVAMTLGTVLRPVHEEVQR